MYCCFHILIFLFISSQGLGLEKWTPQLGDALYPKSFDAQNHIRKGDVYRFEGRLFKALQDDLKVPETHLFEGIQKHEPHAGWLELHHGSILWPKSVDVDERDAAVGDIFLNEGSYWKVVSLHPTRFAPYRYKSSWMTDLNPIIGDERLGDIQYPGTHDSGTQGIDENSYLIDQNAFFQAADAVAPKTVANWSLTHDNSLGEQLELGFRWFDLRIADVEIFNDTFRWWHGLAAEPIFDDLEEIRTFAEENTGEVVMLYFQHFAMPGNAVSGTRPIPFPRREVLSDVIISYLGDFMVGPEGLSTNPTVNDILASGGNIVAIMIDSYIRGLDDRYWPNVIRSSWTGRANPEDLFNQRSILLQDFKENYANQMTDASGACTPNEKSVVAGLKRTFGDWDNITDIIDIIAPEAGDVEPDEMSFEGMFVDLLYTHRDGVNSQGMLARAEEQFTSGASVHYRGLGDMYRHWLARPDKFKPNVLYVDDSWSSTIVDVAIEANRGDIKREVSVVMQGSCLHGYYEWQVFRATGGSDGHNCTQIDARYTVDSATYDVHFTSDKFSFGEVIFVEGEYPLDATVTIDVKGERSEEWIELYSNTIQTMIETNMDLYVRGNGPDINDVDEDVEEESGFAYISETYDHFGEDCNTPPQGGYLNIVMWGE